MGSGVEGGELKLRCEGPHRVGVAGSQPFQGAEGQMVGDHHAAHLGLGQFAGQRFFRQGFDEGEGGADDQRAHRGRHRARVTQTEDLRSRARPGSDARLG